MTSALQQVRWRRAVAMGAATLLLHSLAAGWLGAGAPAAPATPRMPAPIVAQLLAPPSVPTKAGAAVPAAQVQSVQRPARRAAQQPGQQSARRQPAGRAPPRYQVNLPPAAELTFDVARSDAGGESTGEALLRWHRTGASYQLRHTAALSLPHAENLSDIASEGRVGKAGIVPRTATEQRRSRARTATHFNERGNITFSATQNAVAMAAGAQDKGTVPLQLAAIARAGAAQLATGVEMVVGEDKDASLYRFVVVGQEQIETGIGRVLAWRLARLAAPGSYNARLDIWLAPDHEWFPVQLRSTEASGTVTTQTVRRIVVEDAGN